jgi:hypothetical protein
MEAHLETNRRNTAVKRALVIAISVLLALIVALPMALAQGGGQGAKASEKAAKLAVAWTKWAYSKPVAKSPLIGSYEVGAKCDGTPVSPTPGKTWFLAGTPDGSKVVRTCTAPVGTHFFFPVVSATFFITEPEENKKIARDYVRDFIKAVVEDPKLSIVVKVDGKEINSNRIVRAETPFFKTRLPKNNIFAECCDVEAGKYQTISKGLWVNLQPLSKGKHTIKFKMNAPNVDLDPNTAGPEGFSQNNTYHLTVVNSKQVP